MYSNTNNVVFATGNGAQKQYSFSYPIQVQEDLVVKVLNINTLQVTQLVLGTDFSVNVGGINGGSITLLDDNQDWLDDEGDLTSEYQIMIKRAPEINQEADFRNAGRFFAEAHEDRFDRQTYFDQASNEEIKRALLFDEFALYDNPDLKGELPRPENGKYLQWDGVDGKIKNSETTVDLSNYDTKAEVDAKVAQGVTNANNYTDQEIGDLEASDIAVIPSGNLTSTDVQSALEEHQSDIDSLVVASGEANTSSNAGTSADGYGLALAKNLVDLPFKRIKQLYNSVFDIKSSDNNLELRLKQGGHNQVVKGTIAGVTVGSQTPVANSAIFTDIASNGKGVLIAVASSTSIQRSIDNGVTWQTIATGGTNNFSCIAYGENTWVISGPTDGQIMRSVDDGDTWQTATYTGLGVSNVNTITFGEGKFVGIASNTGRQVLSIDKGLSFASASTPLVTTGTPNYRIIYGNGIFVAYNKDTSNAFIYSTVLGAISWIDRTQLAPVFNSYVVDIAFGNGYFLFIDDQASVFRSKSFLSWTRAIQDYIAGFVPGPLRYANGYFVQMPPSSGSRNVKYTLDGTQWFDIDLSVDNLTWASVCGAEGYLVAVNSNGTNGILRIGFDVQYSNSWQSDTGPSKVVMYAVKPGTGATMGPPEGSRSAGTDTRRLLNQITIYGSEVVASLNGATGAVTIEKTGLYRVKAWAKTYRTNNTLLNLENVTANQFPDDLYTQGSIHATDTSTAPEQMVFLDTEVTLIKSQTIYLRHYIGAAGVSAESMGKNLSIGSTAKAEYAMLELELIG